MQSLGKLKKEQNCHYRHVYYAHVYYYKFSLPNCNYLTFFYFVKITNNLQVTKNLSYKALYISNKERLYENNNIKMQSVNTFSITNPHLRNYSI